jgi:3-methyladenine DNA glycosylase AlkD
MATAAPFEGSEVEGWVQQLKERIQAAEDPLKAAPIKAYMKTELPVLGVTVPVLRTAVKAHVKQRSGWTSEEVLQAVWMLWDCNHWTFRSAALEVAACKIAELNKVPAATLDMFERCLNQCEGWAHTDQLATQLLPAVLFQHPGEQARIQAWRTSDSKWVRRAALLWQIPELRKGRGDLALVAEIAQQYKDDSNFFIQKAIGWTLREAAKGHRNWVIQYVAENEHSMSTLAKREALKNVGGYSKQTKQTTKRTKKANKRAQDSNDGGEDAEDDDEDNEEDAEQEPKKAASTRQMRAAKRTRT